MQFERIAVDMFKWIARLLKESRGNFIYEMLSRLVRWGWPIMLASFGAFIGWVRNGQAALVWGLFLVTCIASYGLMLYVNFRKRPHKSCTPEIIPVIKEIESRTPETSPSKIEIKEKSIGKFIQEWGDRKVKLDWLARVLDQLRWRVDDIKRDGPEKYEKLLTDGLDKESKIKIDEAMEAVRFVFGDADAAVFRIDANIRKVPRNVAHREYEQMIENLEEYQRRLLERITRLKQSKT